MIIFKILTGLFKFAIIYVYGYDFIKTKKLLNQYKVYRQLTWYQSTEVAIMWILAIGQLAIPFTLKTPYYSTLIHLIILIIVYRHDNRWVFIGRKEILVQTEIFKLNRVINARLENNTLTFRTNNKTYKLKYPLCKKEYLEKYL